MSERPEEHHKLNGSDLRIARYTFAPVYRKKAKPGPRKRSIYLSPMQVLLYVVFLFWFGLLPLEAWSALFGSPTGRSIFCYLGLLTAFYFGWFRLGLVVLTVMCFLWLF